MNLMLHAWSIYGVVNIILVKITVYLKWHSIRRIENGKRKHLPKIPIAKASKQEPRSIGWKVLQMFILFGMRELTITIREFLS